MNSEELNKAYVVALNIVSKASTIVLEGFNVRKDIKIKKATHDLVTEYDRKVEDYIRGELKRHFPQHNFLGEETADCCKVPDGLTWILDPIDGTTNFVHGSPESAISLALTHDKQIVIGIICCPVLQRLYSACKGRGSFLNGAPIRTSSATKIQETLIGLEISLGASSNELLQRLGKRLLISTSRSHGIRCAGSPALGLAYVAQGIWDVYHTEGLEPWDIAAGVLLVTEAGGHVSDSLGGKFDLENSNILAANSKSLAQDMADLFKSLE